ncbi:MAG: hypothetical protein ABI591_16745 [Kofleriaceae bacterium]
MLIALASCAASEAAPSPAASNITPPKAWTADPALAKTAAAAATGDRISVLGSEAWTDGSRGCYAIWLDLSGGAGPIDDAADGLIAALTKELTGVKIHDRQMPVVGETGTLAFAFEKAPYHGKLRAELTKTGEIRALACMWNQREPKTCEAGCTTMLGAVTLPGADTLPGEVK